MDLGKWRILEEADCHPQRDDLPCHSCIVEGTGSSGTRQGQCYTRNPERTNIQEEISGETGGHQCKKGLRHNPATTSEEGEDIRQDLWENQWSEQLGQQSGFKIWMSEHCERIESDIQSAVWLQHKDKFLTFSRSPHMGRRLLVSGIWCHALRWVFTEVSEEYSGSVLRVKAGRHIFTATGVRTLNPSLHNLVTGSLPGPTKPCFLCSSCCF